MFVESVSESRHVSIVDQCLSMSLCIGISRSELWTEDRTTLFNEFLFVSRNLFSVEVVYELFRWIFRNNATCSLTSSGETQCTCLHGYTGFQCEFEINACHSDPCEHGTCQEISNGFYHCACSPGYTGFHCHIDINECESAPCLHNGICQESAPGTFNCICPSGYSGEIDSHRFRSEMEEWADLGRQCQYGDYQCRSAPCLNNGTCTVSSTGYQCACPAGLTGARCEIDIDECASTPCQNNGICLQSKLNQFECHCPTGNSPFHFTLFQIVFLWRLHRQALREYCWSMSIDKVFERWYLYSNEFSYGSLFMFAWLHGNILSESNQYLPECTLHERYLCPTDQFLSMQLLSRIHGCSVSVVL